MRPHRLYRKAQCLHVKMSGALCTYLRRQQHKPALMYNSQLSVYQLQGLFTGIKGLDGSVFMAVCTYMTGAFNDGVRWSLFSGNAWVGRVSPSVSINMLWDPIQRLKSFTCACSWRHCSQMSRRLPLASGVATETSGVKEEQHLFGVCQNRFPLLCLCRLSA